ncbi:hypothetical protein J4526_03880 [Desulfurococcaceae archaeon MEX13E-LK6-19]|nr:hypothetical protein J4526_03880 [Desulfurococcaceae archaeon MEX13E-LK6-19]
MVFKHVKALSPIIAVLLLIVIAAASSVMLYVFMSGYMSRELSKAQPITPEPIDKVRVVSAYFDKVSDPYLLHVIILSTADSNVTIHYVRLLEPFTSIDLFYELEEPVVLKPGEMRMVTVLVPDSDYEKISGKPVYVYAGGLQGLSPPRYVRPVLMNVFRVYLIYIPDVPGSWGVPYYVYNYLNEKALVITIDSWDKLEDLIRNPPEDAIVINAHDEVVPIPPSWNGTWYDYLRNIGKNIRDHGWIWVSIRGYPFFYVDNGSSRYTVGDKGFSIVASCVGGSAVFWSDRYGVLSAYASDLVDEVYYYTGLSLPDAVNASRQSTLVSGLEPAYVFYSYRSGSNTFYASAAYRLGKGFIIVNGLSGSGEMSDDVVAKIAVATALYTAMKKPGVTRPPTAPLGTHVYLVGIPSVPASWIGSDENLSTAPGLLEEYVDAIDYLSGILGFNYSIIDSLDAFKTLLLQPRDNITVVNLHGELVPSPPTWYSNGSSFYTIHMFDNQSVVELHTFADHEFTLYTNIFSYARSSDALRVRIAISPLAPVHSFGIGFITRPPINNTDVRVFTSELRLPNNDLHNNIDLVVWYNGRVMAEGLGVPYINPHSWYVMELTIYDNNTLKVALFNETGSLIAYHEGVIDPGSLDYRDITYLSLGIWGVPSGWDASYVVKYLEFQIYRGGKWRLVFNATPSNWDSIDWSVYGIPGTGYRWRSLYATIAWNIWRHRWNWCSLKGYPFYYVGDGIHGVNGKYIVGENGWAWLKYLLEIPVDDLQISYMDNGSPSEYPTQPDYTKKYKLLYPPKWIPGEYLPRPTSYSQLPRLQVYYLDQGEQYTSVFIIETRSSSLVVSTLGGDYVLDHVALTTSLTIILYQQNI